MWGIHGGHSKTYASFKVYRGLAEGGYGTLDKSSGDVKVTKGNSQYSLAGAMYGVYKDGSLVTKLETVASGHGTTADKLPNGTYTVKEISAPAGYELSDEAFTITVKGALIYDTYTIEEQRCDSNADRDLIPAFDVTVYKDSIKIELGTLVNSEGPKIGTTATGADDDDHEAVADEDVIARFSTLNRVLGRFVTLRSERAQREFPPSQKPGDYTMTTWKAVAIRGG